MRGKCLLLVMLALLSAPMVCLAAELEGQGGAVRSRVSNYT